MRTDEFVIYLPEKENTLPINFFTISSHCYEDIVLRPKGQIEFDQILFVKEGKGILKCNGMSYELKKGCAFFSGRYLPIEYHSTDNLVTAFLTVQGPVVDELCNYYNCKNFFFCENISLGEYISDIKKIVSEYYTNKRDTILSSLVYAVYVKFFEEIHHKENDDISKISLYIEKNFKNKLTLSSIAEIHDISVSKLCHDFKKKNHCSVFDYILNLRLSYARNYLLTTPNSRTMDAAYNCGFDDVGYFCRAYKKRYGKTPKEDKANQKLKQN